MKSNDFFVVFFFLLSQVIFFSCHSAGAKADLVVVNANIWTGNEKQPRAEAMAIKGDTILAIGTNGEIESYRGDSTLVVDVEGKFLTPGFIDTHVHFLTGGLGLSSVQLTDAKTPQEFIDRIAEFAHKQAPGTWILLGNWDGANWSGLPERAWIDSVTRDNPVFVWRLDGHQALANSLALEKAGITKDTKEVEGGIIVRYKNGVPTGILKDKAMEMMYKIIPPSSDERLDEALKTAMKYMASLGVTSVHNVWDQSDEPGFQACLERAHENKNLITRIYDLESIQDWQKNKSKMDAAGPGDKWLKISGLKGFVDGALGSQTAAFFEPYLNQKSYRGFFVNSPADLTDWITHGNKAGFQVAIHAIGDSAINFLLNTYENIESQEGRHDQRFRIEHLQHIDKNDIPRLAKLNVIASMQPYHCIDDGRWAAKYLDQERLKTTYAFGSLMNSKAIVSFGSDWPVAPPSPLWGIYAAVTRRTLDNKNPGGWFPEQKISPEQALEAYTLNGAYASFEEDKKGTLEPGKLADFVIISDDITKVDPVQIKDLKIIKTYVGGKVVYDSGLR